MNALGKSGFLTGKTEPFGQYVLSGFLETDLCEILIFSRDEENQEQKGSELGNTKVKFYIGEVRCYDSIYQHSKI